ncbi:bifunctional 2-polyprenyl-6-hydroxyphenol methylase/3-demethylubiquinol 3-O-methyltransferase UbiG [Saccharibacillus sp. JS10]|uniref:class I SAM-dependent methyltransferase n=1 Tax=Saccharibacillus sp. JS10 TaxID=2950552 RepID=UPI0021088F7C|nr:class I SAM-dependent methyltransferase [Saccharibacillus sp. JS10]MCQ4088420.1 class I SAM-dependent methyltransferase [Saccharibacillus sp. JS10]
MIPLVYDQVNSWGKDDEFFLALLKKINVKTLADLGCGTGRLTTHFAKEGYEVTAIDPHEEAIQYAKAKESQGVVKWIVGDSAQLQTDAFEAIIMTANVAQVFLTEESWRNVLADAYRALKPGGSFIFDTRNPLAKAWEHWALDTTPDIAKNALTGETLEIWTQYEGFVDDIFTFYETVKVADTGQVLVHEKMELKFRTEEAIYDSLRQANFSHIQVYGDWEFEQATPQARSFIFHATKEGTKS